MLPADIFTSVSRCYDGYGIDLETILDNYRVDTQHLPLLSNHLESNNLDNGLFLQDASGLASHLLGLRLIERWQKKQLFTQYSQVVWLPFAKLLELPVHPTEHVNDTLHNLSKLTGGNFLSTDHSVLLIVTGVDYQLDKKFSSKEFDNCANGWLAIMKNIPHVVVGNYKPHFFVDYDSLEISLPPSFLNLQYDINESGDQQHEVIFPGSLLVNEITNHTRRLFRFEHSNPDGVFSIENSTVHNYMQGHIDIVPELEENVEHLQPLLTIQDVIRLLAGHPTSNYSFNDCIATLDSPAKWYYAALSAEKFHATHPKKKYFLYLISGHIVVRRMTDSSMHYITDLGAAVQYTPQTQLNTEHAANQDIQSILAQLMSRNDFETLDESTIIDALNQEKANWIDNATEKRNEKLIEQGDKAPKYPEKLPSNSHKLFQKICKSLRGDVNDSEITASLNNLTKEQKDASYQTMQREINTLQQNQDDHAICKQIIKVINGNVIESEFSILITLLAANLLSESARNPRAFFALFAMQTIATLDNQKNWSHFAAMPERVNMDMANANWKDLIIADCMDAIGGIHPMAHNGSFLQSHPNFKPGATAVKFGITWPELKTQLLYSHWFTSIINFSGIGIKLINHTVSFNDTSNEDCYLLTNQDQPFLMNEFELYLRVETTFIVKPEQCIDILSYESKPFEKALHMIADPRQIHAVHIKVENENYGCYLEIPKQTDGKQEHHYVHLTPGQAYLIATKFDAIGELASALTIYNYLCNRHFQNVGFRYSRYQCLVLHPDFIKNDTIRSDAQCDFNFFERNRSQLPDSQSQKKIDYLDTIFSIRTTTEDDRLLTKPMINEVTPELLQSAATEAKKVLATFSQGDEETAVLQLHLATVYQQLLYCYSQNELMQLETKVASALLAQKSCYKYLTAYASSLHRTSVTDTSRLHEIFNYMNRETDLIMQNMMFGNFFKAKSQQHWKKHVSFSGNIPEAVLLVQRVLLAWIKELQPHTQLKSKQLKEMRHKMLLSAKGKFTNLKGQIEQGFKKLKQNTITTKIVCEQQKYMLLIGINHQISPIMIESWAELHNIGVELSVDFDTGPCLKLIINDCTISRSDLQPTPHPDSFLTVRHQTVNPSKNDKYFHALQNMFSLCISKIKAWDMSSAEVEKISYHVYANFTLLPTLHLIKNGRVQDAMIELPNCTPIDIVLNWLQKFNFAFHWVNDEQHGRCIFLPQINILQQHSVYNLAISNGNCIYPYLPKKTSNMTKTLTVSDLSMFKMSETGQQSDDPPILKSHNL